MFSVIVPTYNRIDLLSKCLNFLNPKFQEVYQFDYEVLVTDDSTEETTRQQLAKNYTWVRWIKGPQRGPAANRNNGAQQAQGDWLIFIDDDCLPDKNLLNAYSAAILNNKNISVFEGSIKPDRPQESFDEESPINETGGYLWSCNFMIRKSLFLDELSGFDEKFPYAAMEDVELEHRIKKMDIKRVFVKNAIVVHPWRKQENMWSITLKRFKSTLYYLEKHPEKRRQINSRYYLTAFYNSLFKNTLKNACSYNFKGLSSKIIYDMLQLYFSFRLFIKKH